MGRPRNFENNELVRRPAHITSGSGPITHRLYVVVDHEIKPNGNGMYRVVPMVDSVSRAGPATSIEGYLLRHWSPDQQHYRRGSRDVYLANLLIDKAFEEGGRGCRCQCCAHFKQDEKAVLRGQDRADDGGT